jgi:hypothetical protein
MGDGEDLSSLIRQLTEFKSQSRRPTASAYHAVLRQASDYVSRRDRAGISTDNESSKARSLGWEIALAALEDAQRAKLDLGKEAEEQLFRVGRDKLLS